MSNEKELKEDKLEQVAGGIGPNKRQQKNKRKDRRSSDWKIAMPEIVTCPNCGEQMLENKTCHNCGYNSSMKIIEKV